MRQARRRAQLLGISRQKQPARRPLDPERLHARCTPAATGFGRPHKSSADSTVRRPLRVRHARCDTRPIALGSHIAPFSFIFRRYHYAPKRPRNGPAQRQPARLRRGAVSMRRTLGLRVRRRPGGAPPESLAPAAIRPTGAGLFRGAPKYSRGPLATSVRAAARRLASPVLQLRALCCGGGARAEEASPPPRRAPRRPPLSSPDRVRRTEPKARGPRTTIQNSGEKKKEAS